MTYVSYYYYLQVFSKIFWRPVNEVFTRCSRRPTVSFTSRTHTSSRTFSRSWRIITRRERWVYISPPLVSPSEFDYLDVKMAQVRFISLFAENSVYKVGSRSIYVRAERLRYSSPFSIRERGNTSWMEHSSSRITGKFGIMAPVTSSYSSASRLMSRGVPPRWKLQSRVNLPVFNLCRRPSLGVLSANK